MPVPAKLQPLALRNFRLLYFGRTVSIAGSTVSPVALAFSVLAISGSASGLSWVLTAAILPQLGFLLASGVIADRLPRGRVMVTSNTVSAVAQATAAVLLLTGHARLWHLIVIAAITGTGTASFGPASQGILPQLVPAEQILQANALLRLTLNIVKVLGPALGGLVVAIGEPGWGIAWDSLTFAAAALILSRLRVSGLAKVRRAFVHELHAGWTEFWGRTWLWSVVLQCTVINVAWVGGFQLLGPLIASHHLGGAAAWGLITAGLAAGLVVGAAAVLWRRPRRPLLTACVGTAAKTLPLAALALHAPLAVVVVCAVLAGIGTELFVVGYTTTIQQQIPTDMLGRISSYDMLFGTALLPVGYIVAGWSATAIGIPATVWTSVALVLLSTAAVLVIPEVRRITSPTSATNTKPAPALVAARPVEPAPST